MTIQALISTEFGDTSMVKINDNFTELDTNKQWKIYVTVWPTGDYVTDWTADNIQIQEAIDAVNTAGGGIVFINEWTYNLTNWLILKDNVCIDWVFWWTIIKASSGMTWWLILQWAWLPVNNWSIRNITFDWNSQFNCSGIQIYRFNNLYIDTIVVKNINWVWGIRLWEYTATPTVDVSTWLFFSNSIIDNVYNTTVEWMLTTNVENAKITNNIFKNCDLNNASTVSFFLGSKNFIISNNQFENSLDDFGIVDITWSENVNITWNIITHKWTNWSNWIIIRNCKNTNIHWNQILANSNAWYWIYMIDWSWTIDWYTNPFPDSDWICIDDNIIQWFYYSILAFDDDGSKNNAKKNLSIKNNLIRWFNFSAISVLTLKGNMDSIIITWNNIQSLSSWDHLLIRLIWTASYSITKSIISWNILKSFSWNSNTIDLSYCQSFNLYWNIYIPTWTWVDVLQTSCTGISIV